MSVSPSARSRWKVEPRDRAAEQRLEAELGLPTLVAAVLVRRGITDPAEADRFIHPRLENLHPPGKLPDYEPAVREVLGARERNELIFIHGDYDVDGVTSAALLYRFLKTIGAQVHVHVPHRMKEGYGIHHSAVQAAREMGAKLFLTCDCGVAAHEQVKMAHEAGMRVVVTDHHELDGAIPAAEAVINPHRTDHNYPFSELSGVGVAFKFCAGLTQEIGHELKNYYRAFLDLAVLGTVADVMPLVDENRIITRFGLQQLRETKKVGLQALMKVADVPYGPSADLKAWHIGFRLGPRLNAAGRIDDAALSLNLLLEKDALAAKQLAEQLNQMNADRKSEQDRILDEALDQIFADELYNKPLIVVNGDGWHPGIVGIVAGKIAERFHRPAFVLTTDPDTHTAKGSARSIPGFNLADAIQILKAKGIATGGGHAAAAGVSMSLDRLQEVRSKLVLHAHQTLSDEDLIPVTPVDCELDFHEVTQDATQAMELLEPFGAGNPDPRFKVAGVELAKIDPTRNAEHYRVTFRHPDGTTRAGMGFGLGERLAEVRVGSVADILIRPAMETYQGVTTFKWQLKDFVVVEEA